eukprot:CAMPEP_0183347626 /NCGR_PEP_ID=MMETSP0164_2-20130417/12396_1 /TAXON_ID=221442 /ORGANISM="Coccolithus pelagicus ssp braarudi, Strain PLY182g" /LENGTH=651 /DNA_ID=CAMNT_0025519089 /DNA_START=50 /DNA_END=2005 /DNA_ORIENTATION=-
MSSDDGEAADAPPLEDSVTEALREALAEGRPILTTQIAIQLYKRENGEALRSVIKERGGLQSVLLEVAGVRLLYDHPPGFVPPLHSAVREVQPDERGEHLTYLTGVAGASWLMAGRMPSWAAAGAPLPEVHDAIPPAGISINDLCEQLQASLRLVHTVKRPKLVGYLQGYPHLFELSATAGGQISKVFPFRRTSDATATAIQKKLFRIVRQLIAAEPSSACQNLEYLMGCVGGKFGTQHPDLNTFVKAQYGGFNNFMSIHAKALRIGGTSQTTLMPVDTGEAGTIRHAISSSANHLTPRVISLVRGNANRIVESAIKQGDKSCIHSVENWKATLGGNFGNVHPELNAHLRAEFGGFGSFFNTHYQRLLPSGSWHTPPVQATGVSTPLQGTVNGMRSALAAAGMDPTVEWLTMNENGDQARRAFRAGRTAGTSPLPQIVAVVNSYGPSGVAFSGELKTHLQAALQSARTVKLVPLDIYIRAFPGHFRVDEVTVPNHNPCLPPVTRIDRVYSAPQPLAEKMTPSFSHLELAPDGRDGRMCGGRGGRGGHGGRGGRGGRGVPCVDGNNGAGHPATQPTWLTLQQPQLDATTSDGTYHREVLALVANLQSQLSTTQRALAELQQKMAQGGHGNPSGWQGSSFEPPSQAASISHSE